MNLLTDSELHSFDHNTKKISPICNNYIDLHKYAIIKNNKKQIAIASFVDLSKYDLQCTVVDYQSRNLYISKIDIDKNIYETYYTITKKLTEEKVTIDDMMNSTKPFDEKMTISDWIKKNVSSIVSTTDINTYWERYCKETNSTIPIKEWTVNFLTLYKEDQNGDFISMRFNYL